MMFIITLVSSILISLAVAQSPHVPGTPTTQSAAPSGVRSSWSPFLGLPHYRGVNVVNQSPSDPSKPKSPTDWENAFKLLKSMPASFNAARLYSVSESADDPDHRYLEMALDAAKKVDIKIFAGIWSGGDNHTDRFQVEKNAFSRALDAHGCDHILAVSVGNEDIYMNETSLGPSRIPLQNVNLLIEQANAIQDVLMLHDGCCNIQITHTDTINEWVKDEVRPLLTALDFVTVNSFPYWEGKPIEQAQQAFQTSFAMIQNYSEALGKEVWLGETGWPYNGTSKEAAVVSQANHQRYWHDMGCPALQQWNAFYYVLWDNPDTEVTRGPAFGLWNATKADYISDMKC